MNRQIILLLCAVVMTNGAFADGMVRADSHAPIGVMGDHTHGAGEWMLSYRYMQMEMDGNIDGSSGIAPDTIATTVPNRFFGMPGMPPTLRIVPLEMTMDMHMFGLMYAPNNRITLMLMANYLDKSMRHVTYQGGMGTTTLGEFSVNTSGWGDTAVTALVRLVRNDAFQVHLTAGVSFPTGSTDETSAVLTPMNMRPTLRVPYPMQLGSGTYDPIIGATITGKQSKFGWGAQWRSTYRLGDNDDDYSLGNEHRLTSWLSYSFVPKLSASLRLEHYRRGNISGIDPMIAGPVQTADPGRQALNRTEVAVGLNYAASGSLAGWRIATEYIVPVQQNVDGPQLETDRQLIVGLQRSFH